jgi:hypothetical protein
MYYGGCGGFPIGKGFGKPFGFGGWPATVASGFSSAVPAGGGFINPGFGI